MDVKSRVDRINNEKQAQALSYQQLADMSQLALSTVHRTLTGKTTPDESTVEAMEDALGITDKPIGETIHMYAENDPILERYINMQDLRIARMRAHYNMLLAEKNRWIRMLVVLSLVLFLLICGILIFDMMNPNYGWIR